MKVYRIPSPSDMARVREIAAREAADREARERARLESARAAWEVLGGLAAIGGILAFLYLMFAPVVQ